MILNCGNRTVDLSIPKVMGVLNVTPDSFSDGGQYTTKEAALFRALQMVAEGASFLDIGGESTRPYAPPPLSVQEELDRTIPIIEAVSAESDVIISIDTYKPQVMKTAILAGATFVNDVLALQKENALDVVAAHNVGICLMHMNDTPQNMQDNPHYSNVVAEIKDFLLARLNTCLAAGIARNRIVLDPGFGYGKTLAHNLDILRNVNGLLELGQPLLFGLSRKAFIGKLLDADVGERLIGSVVANSIGALNGVSIIRTHDVKPTVDALKIVTAVLGQG